MAKIKTPIKFKFVPHLNYAHITLLIYNLDNKKSINRYSGYTFNVPSCLWP